MVKGRDDFVIALRSAFFKNADLKAITKSSLLVAIFFNIQIT